MALTLNEIDGFIDGQAVGKRRRRNNCPTVHPTPGYFSAVITGPANAQLLAVANAANGSQAQTYNAVKGVGNDDEPPSIVGITSVMKSYYGWNSAITCQNVGDIAGYSSLDLKFSGYETKNYDTAVISGNGSLEIYVPNVVFDDGTALPNGYRGSVIVTANTWSWAVVIRCIVNTNNSTITSGDGSISYNASNRFPYGP